MKMKNDFGVYVLSNKNTFLDVITKKLTIWRNMGKDKAIMPEVIEIDPLHYYAVHPNGLADCAHRERCIRLRSHLFLKNYVFNHEMVHLNDRLLGNEPQNKLKRKFIIKELSNAGLSKDRIKYALTNDCELKAVALEGDVVKYSDKFRQYLTDIGIEDWIWGVFTRQ